MQHELKCDPIPYQLVLNKEKTFEIRFNDRMYQKGDEVIMREYDRTSKFGMDTGYTGREVKFKIGFVTTFAQDKDWCVFSIVNLEVLK